MILVLFHILIGNHIWMCADWKYFLHMFLHCNRCFQCGFPLRSRYASKAPGNNLFACPQTLDILLLFSKIKFMSPFGVVYNWPEGERPQSRWRRSFCAISTRLFNFPICVPTPAKMLVCLTCSWINWPHSSSITRCWMIHHAIYKDCFFFVFQV